MARPELRFAVLSDVGRKRKANEDSNLVIEDAGIFIVADGMGGVEGGAVASQQTVKIVAERFGADPQSLSFADKIKTLRTSLKEANRWIQAWAASRGNKGSGTTFVGLVLDFAARGRSMFLHAGDSRGYRYRGGTLTQITRDHSVANAFGAYNEKVPAMFKNVIVNAIGTQETFTLEETPVSIEVGDILLLCSDGLSGMVPDAAIAEIIKTHAATDLNAAATALIKAANDAGGVDNVTAVLVQIVTPLNAETETEGPATDTHDSLPGAGSKPPEPMHTPANDAPSTDDSEMIASTPAKSGSASAAKPASKSPTALILAIVLSAALAGIAWVVMQKKDSPAYEQAPDAATSVPAEAATPAPAETDAPAEAVAAKAEYEPPSAVRTLSSDEIKSLLASHLETGRLGELDARLRKDSGGAMDQLRAMRDENEVFTAWFSEWSRRSQAPETVDADAKAYLDTLSNIAAILGMPPFTDSDLDWTSDAAGRANVYCRMLHKQQLRFVEATTAAMDRMQEELNVLGDHADVAMKILGVTEGQKSLTECTAEITSSLADFRRWIDRSKARPMMTDELERVALPYATTLQEQMDLFRTELWARVQAISPESLRPWLPSNEVPTVLEIKRRNLASVAAGDAPPWADKTFRDRLRIVLTYLGTAYNYAQQSAPPATVAAPDAETAP